MQIFFLTLFLLISICLICLIMLQQSKNIYANSGTGLTASTTLFGPSGSGTFITKITVILATIFFIINLVLVNIITNKNKINNLKWKNIGKQSEILKSDNIKKIKTNNDVPQ